MTDSKEVEITVPAPAPATPPPPPPPLTARPPATAPEDNGSIISKLMHHRGEFAAASKSAGLSEVKEGITFKFLKYTDNQSTFKLFSGLMGLSNDMNWLTFIFYIFAYATSNFAIDWWKIILPPWSPLIWSLVMYCAFMFCGHERNGLYSPAQFKVPLFAISLFLYFGGFTVFWGILAIIDGIELVDGLCVTVLTVTQCLGGTAWGVPVVICAILNCLLGLLASLVGLKHIMLKKAATPAGQSVP